MTDATLVAFTNQKGGVGKTTVAAHTGVALDRAGNDVLLIDADPQASLSNHFTLDKESLKDFVERGVFTVKERLFPVRRRHDDYLIPLEERLPSIHEAFYHRRVDNIGLRLRVEDEREYERDMKNRNMEPGTIGENIIVGTTDGPDIVPANRELQGIEKTLSGEHDGILRLGQFIEEIDGYDYILVDTPANVDIMKDGAIIAAQNIVIPMHAESQAVQSTRQHIEGSIESFEGTPYVDEGGMNIVAILPSKVRAPIDGEAKDVLNIIRKQVPDRYWRHYEVTKPDGFDATELPMEFWRGNIYDNDGELIAGVPDALDDFWRFAACKPIITDKQDYTDRVTPFEIYNRVAIRKAAGNNRTVFNPACERSCDQKENFEKLATMIEERTGGA